MRRTTFILVVNTLVVAVLSTSVQPAAAYVSSGRDPAEGLGADVIRTTRRVWVRDDGRRYVDVRIQLSPEDQPLFFFRIRVHLDTRGDASSDARMLLVAGDAASGARTPWCTVRALGDTHEADLLGIGSETGCRVRATWLRPTKEIRWRIAGELYYAPAPADVDLAPDRGWYV